MKEIRTSSRNSSKFLLISILSHVVLLFILVKTGVLEADLAFNKESKETIDPETRAKLKKLREAQKMKKQKARLAKTDAALLKKSAERLVRKELRERMIRMVKIRDAMRAQELKKLEIIEKRPDDQKPADFNDTTAATENNENPIEDQELAKLLAQKPDDADIEATYEAIRSLESQIADDSQDKNAAEYAVDQDVSYPKAKEIVGNTSQKTRDFDQIVKENSEGDLAEGDPMNPIEKTPETLGELGEYREFLNKVNEASKSLESSALTKMGGGENEGFLASLGLGGQAGQRSGSVSGRGGGGNSDGEIQLAGIFNKGLTPSKTRHGRVLTPDLVLAQALPGRRIAANSTRKGWLYINTWYMIGPWDMRKDHAINPGKFAIPHPPEFAIDFDAVYYDGVQGRDAVIETDFDPQSVNGRPVKLDGVLRWKFMQSESLHNKMPVTAADSIYYCYTELYFDEAQEMVVAIGTDDSGKLWINDELIWKDSGSGQYYIDEHIARLKFRKGVNKVLIRLENGGSATGISFMLCPPNAVKLSK